MSLLYKISFDTSIFNLHDCVNWLTINNNISPSKFTFNKNYYIFTFLDKKNEIYNGYKTKLTIDDNKGVIKCFLIPPNNQRLCI